MARGEWRTPEREALMRAEYEHSTDAVAFHARLNALPGPPISNESSIIRVWARRLGIRKTPAARAVIQSDTAKRGGFAAIGRLLAHRKIAPIWTPARVDLLLARYAEEGATALVAPLSALPGEPLTANSIREKVWKLKLHMTPEARRRLQQEGAEVGRKGRPPKPAKPPRVVKQAEPKAPKTPPRDLSMPRAVFVEPAPAVPDLPPEEQAAIADAAMDLKRAKARAMLAKKACPHAVAAKARLPLREVFRLHGEMRA